MTPTIKMQFEKQFEIDGKIFDSIADAILEQTRIKDVKHRAAHVKHRAARIRIKFIEKKHHAAQTTFEQLAKPAQPDESTPHSYTLPLEIVRPLISKKEYTNIGGTTFVKTAGVKKS